MSDEAPSTFEETCLPLLPDCYAFALSLTHRRHEAEDLVQETFLKAQRAFASFTPGTNAKAWLFTILRRLHIDAYRRGRLRPTPLPEEELAEMARLPRRQGQPEDLPWDDLPPGAVEAAIDRVPDPFRLPVRLRDLDGLPYKEIGIILNVPPGTVMSRLHRGREYLHRVLVSQAAGRARPQPRGAAGDGSESSA